MFSVSLCLFFVSRYSQLRARSVLQSTRMKKKKHNSIAVIFLCVYIYNIVLKYILISVIRIPCVMCCKIPICTWRTTLITFITIVRTAWRFLSLPLSLSLFHRLQRVDSQANNENEAKIENSIRNFRPL